MGTLSVALALLGCANVEEPPSDPQLREALGLSNRVPIHRIDLSGRGAEIRLLPPHLEIETGAVVQFVVLDRRVHHIRFVSDSLPPGAHRFLERTRQEASPALVRQGTRFVVSFDGAPAGEYPFVVEGHGDPIHGRITVRGP